MNRLKTTLAMRWLDGQRVRAYSVIVLVCALPSLWMFHQQALGTNGSDFLAFWSAGRLVVAGTAASAYDTAATMAVQGAAMAGSGSAIGTSEVFAFVNPPQFLFFASPLGLFSYPLGWWVWTLATYLLWFLASRRIAPRLALPVAAFPGAIMAAWHAQTGLLTSAFQAGIATNLRRRPWLAGACCAMLVIKPHLALLLPVAFIAGRHWRAFAGAALGVIAFTLATWLVFGSDVMLAYPRSWADSRELMETGSDTFFVRQVTVYAFVRLLAGHEAAVAAQLAASSLVIVASWIACRKSASIEGQMAFVLAATPLATPYLFSYDLPFLVLPVAWLATRRLAGAPGAPSRAVLALQYMAPLLCRSAALPMGMNLTPFACAWLAGLVWRQVQADIREEATATPAAAVTAATAGAVT
ncbi:DUF2029 domain-containing protein [Novosphingobium sp. YJ-S2-02]|uniref:DUF2029 domain-containing protein n=1 Tax=Novosphingobium aureum TaxID=2792964 RepID=A0A931HB71_9SPHN|nr:glycosyltransferase family 87 protein [Novosphingobium aureum]MBH0112564.1 DUF2029 domain-containing protein [Novosphingobium aureum]